MLWLTVLFASFGLFAPRNVTVIIALFLCALAGFGRDQASAGYGHALRGTNPTVTSADPHIQ
jgi:hypothetical protein